MESESLTTSADDELDSGDYRRLGGPVLELEEGARVDYYLAKRFPFLTRAGWQRRLRDEKLLRNGQPLKPAAKLKAGDELHFYHPPAVEPPVDAGIAVLWESAGVMAVFKPGNLPMHENGPYRKNTFAEILSRKIGREWAAVHRLDRETSGIVLCAATNELRSRLAVALAGRRVKKEYLAIGRGVPAESAWRVDGPIGDLAASRIRIKKWVVDGGQPAVTGFEVVDTRAGHSLLRALPVTGRTNQIRIHSAYSGHVLLGDKLYHPDERVFLEYYETGTTTPWIVEQTGFHRCCLHAAALEFVHPELQRECRVETPLPDDMRELWLGLPSGSPAKSAGLGL
jgi:RluA family pseudouridine synthase